MKSSGTIWLPQSHKEIRNVCCFWPLVARWFVAQKKSTDKHQNQALSFYIIQIILFWLSEFFFLLPLCFFFFFLISHHLLSFTSLIQSKDYENKKWFSENQFNIILFHLFPTATISTACPYLQYFFQYMISQWAFCWSVLLLGFVSKYNFLPNIE